MKTLLIINVGQPPQPQLEKYGDFEHWAYRVIKDVDINTAFLDGINTPLPPYDSLAGVIIMGSLSMVTEKTEWMLRLSQNIVELNEREIPLFGICFGHQLIAQALGGQSGYNPKGLEIGTVELHCHTSAQSDVLFHSLPRNFPAQTVHFQSVLELPPGAECLASSDLDPHHAFRVGSCTWGVQFHPEFTPEAMRDSIVGLQNHLGDNYQLKLVQVEHAEHAKQVLVRFAKFCADR